MEYNFHKYKVTALAVSAAAGALATPLYTFANDEPPCIEYNVTSVINPDVRPEKVSVLPLSLVEAIQISERKYILLDRLESLKALNDGWYGNNSYAVEDMAYANAKLLIESVPVETLIHWVLFANKNGTLAFRRKSAPITNFTIGNKEYGYIIISLDNRLISGKDKFDIEKAKALFIELSK